jgi:hypothetical protein
MSLWKWINHCAIMITVLSRRVWALYLNSWGSQIASPLLLTRVLCVRLLTPTKTVGQVRFYFSHRSLQLAILSHRPALFFHTTHLWMPMNFIHTKIQRTHRPLSRSGKLIKLYRVVLPVEPLFHFCYCMMELGGQRLSHVLAKERRPRESNLETTELLQNLIGELGTKLSFCHSCASCGSVCISTGIAALCWRHVALTEDLGCQPGERTTLSEKLWIILHRLLPFSSLCLQNVWSQASERKLWALFYLSMKWSNSINFTDFFSFWEYPEIPPDNVLAT